MRGPPRWLPASGALAGALQLDGASNYLECADSAEFGVTDSVTIALWFKADNSRPDQARTEALLGKDEAWGLFRRCADGAIQFVLDGARTPTNSPSMGRSPELVSKRRLDDGRWHHAAGTYDGKRAVLYIDGAEETATPASGDLALTTAPLRLGESTIDRGHFFNGALADARVYSRALSGADVRELFQAGQKP